MNLEQIIQVCANGPSNIQQRSVLLLMCGLSEADCTVYIDNQTIFSSLDIPVRNLTLTLNELIKKGWIEVLSENTYRIDPAVGVAARGRLNASLKNIYKDTDNWAPERGSL